MDQASAPGKCKHLSCFR